KRTEDTAGMEPARAFALEDGGPVDVSPLQLRNGSVPAIGAADTGADAEAALHEVEPVARRTADTVELHPAHVRLIDTALIDQVLHQPSHGIVGKGRDERRVEPEAALQPAGDVVLAAR